MKRAAVSALAALLAVPGCSLGRDDEPRRASGATKRVAAVVSSLERAIRRRDFATICDDLFTAAARRRAGGRDCARLLAESGREVRRPGIEILGIELRGDSARVRVRTRAQGQRPVVETIVLVREAGEYRIESLAA